MQVSFKGALLIYTLFGVFAILCVKNGPPVIRRWAFFRDFAVEVTGWVVAWWPS
jgi:hypothetical protein